MQDNITNPMVSNKYKGIPILKIDLTSYMKANNIRGIPIVINKASMVLNESNWVCLAFLLISNGQSIS